MDFLKQLKWQLLLLQRNNVIVISFAVTLIYGLLLFFFKDFKYIDKLLVSLVLNDPSVIGYFFIALIISTEIKQGILSAIFAAPVNLHSYIISRVTSLSIVGVVCSLALALFIKGLSFSILNFILGSLAVCIISALVGLIMVTYATEFLRFVLLSVPIFLFLINLPLFSYLGVFDLGYFLYIFPTGGSLDLLAGSLEGGLNIVDLFFDYSSVIIFSGLLYMFSLKRFRENLIFQ
ncbi:hypothetical protein C0584_03580 [Candidatus Parcubacteria bacterium]|nr:MAG: hypothetical protein C0584_03580 [Candidatus Parcubacteria bacterium]